MNAAPAPTLESLKKAHTEADAESKKLLENVYGEEAFKPRNITERVKTFEDALAIVSASDNEQILLDYNGISGAFLAAQAMLKLSIIAAALNEGWKPDWKNTSQYKYYPWFKASTSGSGLSFSVYACVSTSTGVGSRLCFKTAALAEYAGKQFEAIYNDFMSM